MRSMPCSVARIVSRPAEHPIVADDGGIARLRRFDASLLDAALERPKRLERGNGTGAVVGHGEMNEGAVAELQGQVANALRRLLRELSKHLRDQALVFFRLVRPRLVAHEGPLHRHAPWAAVQSSVQCKRAGGRVGARLRRGPPPALVKTSEDAQRIRANEKKILLESFGRLRSSPMARVAGGTRAAADPLFERNEEWIMTDASAGSAKAAVLALTSVASFMAALDALVVTTALNTIRLQLGTSIEALEWAVNAYNLSFAVLLMTGAALGDRFGRRRMFVAGLALFVAASAACALAPSAGWLIAARTVQGAGAALVMPLAMALLSAAYPPQERAKALGIFSGLTGLALIAGPVVGGVIAEGLDWQWIFWLNIPIGLVAISLARSRIPESFGPGTGVDIPGVALVTASALGLAWGLMRGNGAGWISLEVVTALAAGFLLALAFVAWELRAGHPMVPMRLFGARAFASGIAACFLFSASLYGTLFLLPQFLQTAQGQGPLGAGLQLLPWTATLFVVAPIAGGPVNRLG